MHLAFFLMCSQMLSREGPLNDLPPLEEMTLKRRGLDLKLQIHPWKSRNSRQRRGITLEVVAHYSNGILVSLERETNYWPLDVLGELYRLCGRHVFTLRPLLMSFCGPSKQPSHASEATVASSTLNKSLQRVAGSILVSNPKGLLCKCRIQPPPLPPPPPFNHTGVRGNKGRKGTSPVVGGLNQMKGNEILVCVCVEEGEEVVNVSIQKSTETHKQSRNCASNS